MTDEVFDWRSTAAGGSGVRQPPRDPFLPDAGAFEEMFVTALRKSRERLDVQRHADDVVRWAHERCGVEMWSLQREIAETVRASPRTAVWSCHDTGKSFAAAVIVCHHIDTHPIGQARAITTAPSGHQVRGVLWVEINALFERARERGQALPGRVNQTEWWIGSYQAAIGRKPNEYRADQFAGFHARFPLVVLDEADGLDPEMWEGVEALLTNRRAKLFAIGNPLDRGSRFAKIRAAWDAGDTTYKGIVIPYSRTPNFTGEDVSEYLKDVLLSQEWVEVKRRTWGDHDRALTDPTYQPVDNPFWHGRVLADYPPEDSSSIITGAMIQRSTDPDRPVPQVGLRQLGVDVAGSEAGDWTTCRERVGDTPLRQWRIRTSDDDAIEDFIVQAATEARAQVVVLDAGGVGFGFTGRLRRRLPRASVVAVQFGSKATVMAEDGKTRKFTNLRAQLYWEVGRENLRQGLWNLAHMEEAEETIADLCAPRLDTEVMAKNGLIQVEAKDEVKRRLGRSPDSGDALLLAFHTPRAGGVGRIHSARGRMLPTGAAVAAGRRA